MKQITRTYSAKPADFPMKDKDWFIVDADGKILGRMAVKVANVLRGKDKPSYTPHVDTGAFVVIVNAEKIKLTGAKLDQKIYYRPTGFIGNLKSETAREALTKKPEEVVKHAIAGMLPKNRLGRAIIEKLKIYAGPAHPHTGQRPAPLEV